jgi:hypothetical protein
MEHVPDVAPAPLETAVAYMLKTQPVSDRLRIPPRPEGRGCQRDLR